MRARAAHNYQVHRLPVIQRDTVEDDLPNAAMPEDFGRAAWPALTDRDGRRYSYLRLSLTDRCDLACVYCMPASGESEHAIRKEMLQCDEVVRVVNVFARGGIRRVRFTGGEPLVRNDIVEIVDRVHREANVDELVMTTNATRLRMLAKPLKDAGLTGVNVSVDSFDAETFARVTRGGDLHEVLRGIDAALDAGLIVKTNTVVLRGENEHELADIVQRVWALGATPRFIELMPLGTGADILDERHVGVDAIVASLGGIVHGAREFVLNAGPARYMSAADGSSRRVGFITAMSESFCDSCNRVRVTASGSIRACLATRRSVSLRDAMRRGESDRELFWAIHTALSTKEASHHFLTPFRRDHRDVAMSLIGG